MRIIIIIASPPTTQLEDAQSVNTANSTASLEAVIQSQTIALQSQTLALQSQERELIDDTGIDKENFTTSYHIGNSNCTRKF